MSATPNTPQPLVPGPDGWYYHPETGEAVCPINAHEGAGGRDWLPTDVKGVEWVLELMCELETNVQALKARKKMLVANMDTLIKREEHKIGRIRHFYTSACAEVVAPLMGKLKSWTCPWGKLRIASTRPKIEVVDEPSAVTYLRQMDEDDAIKLGVLKSKISDALAASLLENPEIALQYGFRVQEAEAGFVLEAKPPTTEGDD